MSKRKRRNTKSETNIDMRKCEPGDVLVRRDGRLDKYARRDDGHPRPHVSESGIRHIDDGRQCAHFVSAHDIVRVLRDGKQVAAVSELSAANYFAPSASISASAIRAAIRRRGPTVEESELSMLHMHWAMTKPENADEPTPAMRWGKLVHAFVLEPYTVRMFDGDARRGKAWADFEADCAANGFAAVTVTEANRLDLIRAAINANPEAARVLAAATERERIYSWMDAKVGACKAKIDLAGNGIIADLKTMRSVDRTALCAAVYLQGLDVQLAWYSAARYWQDSVRCIIAVESKPPHAVHVVDFTEQQISAAYDYALAIANIYRAHELSCSFPPGAPARFAYDPPAFSQNDNVDMEGVQ